MASDVFAKVSWVGMNGVEMFWVDIAKGLLRCSKCLLK